MTLRNYIIIAALGSVLAVRAQEEPAAPVFRPPFDFPLILSGNFGELRSNHFHGGVDFKTQGEVGKPIHCIADGYVSRVLVTPGGYGQAIFITHPNGYTSVYGHVLKFASAVAKVVEEYQYRHETFAVDLKFEPHQVSFKAGEIIALSGNEGYSFGPHLHMEIRRTDTGELIDPLQFYTDKIKDTTPPRASMIMLYPQRGAGVVEGSQRKKSISVASLGQPVSAWGKIAAGIKAYDYMDGTHNNYGVRSVVLYVDTTEVFRSTVDGVLPEENRMINAWTDYEENVKRHNWVMRSQILPGNSLRMLQANDEGGVVTIDEVREKVDDPEFYGLLENVYENGGYKLLGYADQGFRVMSTNKMVESLADFKGQKIRTMENSYHMDFWKKLKASPTPMSFSEVYIGLQQGTIDAQENPYEVIVSNKLYEQQDYVVETNHLPHLISLIVSDEFFQDLPEDKQAILVEAAEIAKEEARQASDDRIADKIKVIEDSGTQIVTLSDELRAEIREAVQPVYDEIEKNVDKKLYNAYMK